MKNCLLANRSAILTVAIVGVVIFGAVQLCFVLMAHTYIETHDGYVMIYPDEPGGVNLSIAIATLAGLIVGVYVARSLHKRSREK